MSYRILFLGGNGHCASRLAAVRDALITIGNPFELVDVLYPGFEGRPRVATFDEFLDAIHPQLDSSLIYATGIGGLFALALRARGTILDTPIILQAPVLWGLERRWFPWFMRRGLWRLFPLVLRSRRFQQRFARKKFVTPPSPETLAAFFAGYQQCEATTDFFHWLTPSLLRQLELDFEHKPKALDNISFWWGERDAVVTLDELACTEKALGRKFSVRTFPQWGHYPMIDDPVGWVKELAHVVAAVA